MTEAPEGWRCMSTIRFVHDGRHVLLVPRTPEEMPAKSAWTDGGVIGHWWPEEREWFIATDPKDLGGGSGGGLIDDDFIGWRELPLPEGLS